MIEILNKVYTDKKENFYKDLKQKIQNEEKTFIITANPEIVILAEKNAELENIILSKDVHIVSDGIGIMKASEELGLQISEKIPGVEIAEKLIRFASENSRSVYFYGSSQKTLDMMKEVVDSKYSDMVVSAMKNGYDFSEDEIIKDIQEKRPDIVLVALGMPRQELFIGRLFSQIDKGVCIGVGGSLDVLSGSKKRAPRIFLTNNLEWLYRIIREPKRLRRFFKYNIKFYIKMKRLKRK